MIERVLSRVVVVGLAAGLVALAWVTPSAAQDPPSEEGRSVTTTISKGAWYAQVPACVLPIDCSVLPPANPYPEDTLHVALSGGEETARTYIALSVVLPPGGVLTGGTLELPIDSDPSHGSVSPETAKMVACLASSEFEPVRGSADKPPATKCAVRKGAFYDEEKELFTVELNRFVDAWDEGIAALALLPSESAREGTDTWHVVFPAAKEASEGERPITATLTYTILEDTDTTNGFDLGFGPEPAPADPPPMSGSGLPPPQSFAPPAGAVAPPVAPVAPAAPAPTEAFAPQPASAVARSTAGFAGEGFAYPIVWAFPLILLVGYGLIGRALTKEL